MNDLGISRIRLRRARQALPVAALALLLCGTAARAADLPLRQTVSQFGVTWTFSQPAPVGQFVNGDYYVVGAVTITGISPAPVYGANARNGSTLNPPTSGYVGYDSRITNYWRSNLMAPLPIQMRPGDSLVTAVSVDVMGQIPNMLRPQDRSNLPLKTAAVLTCMGEQVAADAFRPSFMDTTNRVYLARNLRRSLLPRLPRVAATPTLAEYERYLERPWADSAWFGFAAPMENMPVYGREFARLGGMASLLLCVDYAPEQKETLLVRFVQLGIDLWGMVRAGHRGWNAHGGHHSGRKWPIIFAGIMLGDPDMQRPNVSYPNVQFQEDMQTMHDRCWTGATAVYAGHYGSQGHPSHPDWGPYEHLHPSQWPGTIGENYRRCCTSIAWIGPALAAMILHARDEWVRQAYFDYCDRWMTEDDSQFARIAASYHPGSDWWYTAAWARQRQCWDAFVEQMWATYRNNLPPEPAPAWAVLASHGALGEVATPVADGYAEPRAAGLRKFQITFPDQINPATAVPAALAITGQASGDQLALVQSLGLDAAGVVLTVTLSGALPDGDRYTIAVTDVLRTMGGQTVAGDRDIAVSVLTGDVDGSGQVTAADILAVRAAAGQTPGPDTIGLDVDGSGQVTASDLLAVRARLGRQLP